jgi:hypothetical protein
VSLVDRIIAVVSEHPALTTIGICREARARKCDVCVDVECETAA